MTTAIEWCDEVWNPTVGCSRVSAGCENCYAIAVARRNMAPAHRGLTKWRDPASTRPGSDWTGEVRTLPERLEQPLRWRKPRRIFVNSMSDLFHPAVPLSFIAEVWGVMQQCERHTFLVLTKRPERAVAFFDWLDEGGEIDYRSRPLPNVHLGVSAEDQATWDERVPLLFECPASVRWVSCEPLLGPIDPRTPWLEGKADRDLEWIVIGGESGPGARPCDVEWIRGIMQRSCNVPIFVKQLGAHFIDTKNAIGGVRARPPAEYGPLHRRLRDHKGGDMEEWPGDLRVREYPSSPW